MLPCFQHFHEKVSELMSRGNVMDLNFAIVNVVSYGVVVNINVFGLAVFHEVVRDVKRCLTVGEERNRARC